MVFIADDMPKNGSKTSISVNGFVCYCQTTVFSVILLKVVYFVVIRVGRFIPKLRSA